MDNAARSMPAWFNRLKRLRGLKWLALALAVLATMQARAQLPAPPGIANWQVLESYVPSWPINDIGPAIDPDLIAWWENDAVSFTCPGRLFRYSAFPSKYSAGYPEGCNSNDASLFNGLLCAAGYDEGCRAVSEGQDNKTGEWYRNPVQATAARHECIDDRASLGAQACHVCNNTFSPDGALGTLLYVVKKGDGNARSQLRKWFDDLESIGSTTKLCNPSTGGCLANIPWPRLCHADGGCNAKGADGSDQGESVGTLNGLPVVDGTIDLNGYTTGACTLIVAKDTKEYGEVSDAEDVALGPLMNRAVDAGAAVIGVLTPGGLSDREGVVSDVSSTAFPLHLEATRVLLRMLIQNPALSTSRLPQLPDLEGLIALPEGPSGLQIDGIHQDARIIFSKQDWNPFYNLLANGPTQKVHDDIISLCPTTGQGIDRSGAGYLPIWRWESDKVEERDVKDSMGWDCVFAGRLYNLMRVQLSWKQSLDQIFNQIDPLYNALTANIALLKATSTALATAQGLCEKGATDVQNAIEFKQETAPALIQGMHDQIDQANKDITNWQQQFVSLSGQLPNALNKLLSDTCKSVDPNPPYLPPGAPRAGNVWVPLGCDVGLHAEQAAVDALNNAIAQVNQNIANANNLMANLTQQIADTNAKAVQQLAAATDAQALESLEQACRDMSNLRAQVDAQQARDSDIRRAYAHVRSDVEVWQNTVDPGP